MLLHKPSDAEVRNFLAEQSKLSISYPEVGATRSSRLPAGYPINHYRGKLGAGGEMFERAVASMRAWEMYSLDWTKLCWPDTPVREGEVVGVLAHHLGLWSLNACRIIYTLEEERGDSRRTGFAFGTLPGHVEEGEERFTVELKGESGEVSYELFAFARPKPLVAKIAYPIVRALQRRFAQDSCAAMRRAVNRRGE
ncbi:MAG TPA: DUF1990 domain-containing protein [Pyrinomonadaceae bacterium]|nr:DUF1990 domain-containing protein [Pyrinomonadaceae bacterium]